MSKAKKILLENIPKDCYWEDMNNLTNTPVRYVERAIHEYAEKFADFIKSKGGAIWDDNIWITRDGKFTTKQLLRQFNAYEKG